MRKPEVPKARSGSSSRARVDERVLILAPVGRDAALACEVLTRSDHTCLVVADAKELRRRLRQGVGAVLLTEEALTPETREVIRGELEAQPAWSDLPLILVTKDAGRHLQGSREAHTDALHALGPRGNVTLIERPIRLPTLTSMVGASLRARRRQYELRDLLGQLRELNETLERRVDERTRALERSEEQFTLALHLSPAPMVLVDPSNEYLVDVNDAFLRLTGFERAEAVERTTLDLNLFVRPRALTATPGNNRNEPQPPSELLIRTKPGEQRSVLSASRLIEWNGKAMLLAALFDITERKQTEEQLSQAIQEVMNDTSWFSQKVMERLAHVRTCGRGLALDVDLSKRERQVLERLANGLNNDAIAAELGLATQTVRNYISTVYDKIGVHARGEAIVWARERGIVSG